MTPPAFSPLSGRFVLERGSRGIEVEGLQQRLAWLGYDPGPADGVFGARTQPALSGLPAGPGRRPPGRPDQATAQALARAVEERAAGGAAGADQGDTALQRALELCGPVNGGRWWTADQRMGATRWRV